MVGGLAAQPHLVSRAEELRALASLAERGTHLPVLLHGPEAYKKTRLPREPPTAQTGIW
ncbi:hypothetical protein Pyrfu_0452 [Pyrolobus fumarii 1A]|uniref:Uncharacterized protein n=1 Tax=Pyrolobus fumarii (strain DSM 11204 / 1A) TaxID=694429 RepID=G0EG75_PYRF1|nr:hypothetical protein [Pyrolobus fumarii]AEM38323.1 hypothetical protein Pyrfu_0452 [Pyrolobus fumarii 1A]